jgi:hypothetical protein
LLLAQIHTLCQYIFRHKWNATLSLKTILTVKIFTSSLESHSKTSSELFYAGQLHVARVVKYTFPISNFSAEYFALLHVTCVAIGENAPLICLGYERKALEFHPPEIQSP